MTVVCPADATQVATWIALPGHVYLRPVGVPAVCEPPLLIVAYTPLWWAHWCLGIVGPFVVLVCAIYVGRDAWRKVAAARPGEQLRLVDGQGKRGRPRGSGRG